MKALKRLPADGKTMEVACRSGGGRSWRDTQEIAREQEGQCSGRAHQNRRALLQRWRAQCQRQRWLKQRLTWPGVAATEGF